MEPFVAALTGCGMTAPELPVIAGVDAMPVYGVACAIDTLARQIAQPVRWAECIDTMREISCTVLLELGPGAALARMAAERHPDLPARSLDDFRDVAAAAAWVGRSLE